MVRVASDGSVEYERTGGVPTATPAFATLTGAPSNHGLSPMAVFTVQPGTSVERGNVVVSCPAGGSACILRVGDDGTPTYDRTGGIPGVAFAYNIVVRTEPVHFQDGSTGYTDHFADGSSKYQRSETAGRGEGANVSRIRLSGTYGPDDGGLPDRKSVV